MSQRQSWSCEETLSSAIFARRAADPASEETEAQRSGIMENFNTVIVVAVIALQCRVVVMSRMVSTLLLLGLVSTLARHLDGQASPGDMSHNFIWTRSQETKTETSLSFADLLDLDPVELIRYYGYPGEYHWVTTADGYILGLHRIVGGSSGAQGKEKRRGTASHTARPAVIMAHPLLACSADWIVAGPGKSLAFMLADEGYDVWLFNARGNTYSRNHTTLSPDNDVEFWDFSIHEHGTLDMPAMVEYVLNVTGQEKVQYVGFSMGTTTVWLMGSTRPEVAAKLRMVTALGPLRDAGHVRSELALIAIHPYLLSFFRMIRYHEFMRKTTFLKTIGLMFCSDGKITQGLCEGLVSSVSGSNEAQFNRTLMPLIFARTPAGTSLKNIVHFQQTHRYANLRYYDYGDDENVKRYGSAEPPLYDLSRLPFPIRIHYGLNDLLANWKDVEELCRTFPTVLSCDRVLDPLWNHLDFIWGINAAEFVYRKVVDDIKESDAKANDDKLYEVESVKR